MEGTGIVVVTSPEPGAGRTSVCLGLGAALAGMGRRAAVVDCNLENAQLAQDARRAELRRAHQRSRRRARPWSTTGTRSSPGCSSSRPAPILSDPASLLEEGGGPGGDAMACRRPGTWCCSTRRWREGYYGPRTSSAASTGSCSSSTPPRTPKGVAREATDDLLAAGVNLLGVVLNGCS